MDHDSMNISVCYTNISKKGMKMWTNKGEFITN